MKVIILKTSEIKDVSLGYAINYLLPKKLAVIATKKELLKLERRVALEKDGKKVSRLENQRLADKFNGKVVTLKVKAGKAGKVHGSITKKEIAKTLKILKNDVVLEKPIKKVGEHDVELKFGKVKAKVKVKIVAI